MNSSIFVPQKIKVGFQERNDTYTKKLAYVIYYDQKNKLRKEASWQSWRDDKIEPLDFDNVPTDGFVLNKKAGGYATGWNHRQTYCRVYDPRGYEFEITIPNLLYILENTNSIKGKGLEGQFVYGWDGSDLILIPTSSPDYQEIAKFNKIIYENKTIKAKDLIIGATYLTKNKEEWVYMGRFDLKDVKSERIDDGPDRSNYWSSGRKYHYEYHNISKGKHHFFVKKVDYDQGKYMSLLTLKSLGDKFIDAISNECSTNYAELFDWMECQVEYSHRDESKDVWLQYTIEEFKDKIANHKFTDTWWGSEFSFYSTPEKKEKMHYDIENLQFWHQGKYDRSTDEYKKNYIGNVVDIFNKYNPVYKIEYLENGKEHRRIE